MLGVDHALFEGHLRSDKGPGQPVLAAPFYMLARAVGAPAISAKPRKTDDLMLWWLTLTTSVLPFALLCALAYRRCARVAPRGALVATLSLLIASIALPVTTSLFAHSLSALLGYAAYALIVDTWPSRWRMLAAGALTGAAIANGVSARHRRSRRRGARVVARARSASTSSFWGQSRRSPGSLGISGERSDHRGRRRSSTTRA